MDITDLIKTMFGGINSEDSRVGYWGREFPLNTQLTGLGIRELLGNETFRKGKVLDLGCGARAELVHYLRSNGVRAEGLDPRVAIQADYLMRIGLTPTSRVPRADGYYDFILAHSFIPFWSVFSNLPKQYAQHKKIPEESVTPEQIIDSSMCLSEVFRLLRTGGKLISLPALDKIDLYKTIALDCPRFVYTLEETGIPSQEIPLWEQRSIIKKLD